MAEHWQIVNLGGIMVGNTPEEIWRGACEFFKHCDSNPVTVKTTLKSGKEAGKVVLETHQRPYTIKGLCLHLGVTEEFLRDMRNVKDKSSLWYITISKIYYIIYTQAQEMGTLGIFNPIFTAKILNLDKEEVSNDKIRIEVITGGNIPSLSDSENAILEKLELEIAEKKFDER